MWEEASGHFRKCLAWYVVVLLAPPAASLHFNHWSTFPFPASLPSSSQLESPAAPAPPVTRELAGHGFSTHGPGGSGPRHGRSVEKPLFRATEMDYSRLVERLRHLSAFNGNDLSASGSTVNSAVRVKHSSIGKNITADVVVVLSQWMCFCHPLLSMVHGYLPVATAGKEVTDETMLIFRSYVDPDHG